MGGSVSSEGYVCYDYHRESEALRIERENEEHHAEILERNRLMTEQQELLREQYEEHQRWYRAAYAKFEFRERVMMQLPKPDECYLQCINTTSINTPPPSGLSMPKNRIRGPPTPRL